jgi:hypothetical protein
VAFTYDLTTDRGKTRLKLADTDAETYVFEDAEVDYFLSVGGTVNKAAIEGLRVLIVDAARRQKFFVLKGLSFDNRGQVAALKESISQLGGMPTVTINMPALLPMDVGFDESNP